MNRRETLCVNALLKHLVSVTATDWSTEVPDLDARYPDRPSPECIVGDGQHTAAVEVKGLRGPQDQSDFFGDLRYLGRILAPTTPGHFVLGPPYDNSPRWGKGFIRLLKREIEKVARKIEVGGQGFLRIPRRCRVVMGNDAGAWVSCYHGHPEPLRKAEAFVEGAYMVIDEDGCAALETDEGKLQYSEAIRLACAEAKRAQSDAWAEWSDDWPIWRSDEGESYVEVIAVCGAFSVPAAVGETVWKAIEDGRRKFSERWAARHILLLDSQFALTDVDRVREVVEAVVPEAYGEVDEVFLYWDKSIWPLYPPPTAPPAPSPPVSA